jgi:hypothetical protein
VLFRSHVYEIRYFFSIVQSALKELRTGPAKLDSDISDKAAL